MGGGGAGGRMRWGGRKGGGGGTVGGGADAAILALWPADLHSMGMQTLRQCADFLGGKFCNSFARANFPVQKFNILPTN